MCRSIYCSWEELIHHLLLWLDDAGNDSVFSKNLMHYLAFAHLNLHHEARIFHLIQYQGCCFRWHYHSRISFGLDSKLLALLLDLVNHLFDHFWNWHPPLWALLYSFQTLHTVSIRFGVASGNPRQQHLVEIDQLHGLLQLLPCFHGRVHQAKSSSMLPSSLKISMHSHVEINVPTLTYACLQPLIELGIRHHSSWTAPFKVIEANADSPPNYYCLMFDKKPMSPLPRYGRFHLASHRFHHPLPPSSHPMKTSPLGDTIGFACIRCP